MFVNSRCNLTNLIFDLQAKKIAFFPFSSHEFQVKDNFLQLHFESSDCKKYARNYPS